MANIAVLRMEGWALAKSMGRVSHKEAQSAGYATGYAVDYLGCGNSRAWQAGSVRLSLKGEIKAAR